MTKRIEKSSCQHAIEWLDAWSGEAKDTKGAAMGRRVSGELLAALTGTDARALRAFAHLVDLLGVTGRSDAHVLRAMFHTAERMQPKTRPLAQELIACGLDWGDRDPVWAAMLAAGRSDGWTSRER